MKNSRFGFEMIRSELEEIVGALNIRVDDTSRLI